MDMCVKSMRFSMENQQWQQEGEEMLGVTMQQCSIEMLVKVRGHAKSKLHTDATLVITSTRIGKALSGPIGIQEKYISTKYVSKLVKIVHFLGKTLSAHEETISTTSAFRCLRSWKAVFRKLSQEYNILQPRYNPFLNFWFKQIY